MPNYPRRSIPPILDEPRARGLTLDQQRTLLLLPLVLDDAGRALDDPGTLNGLLWGPWWEQHPPSALDADLAALERAGFVQRYTVEGVAYLQMTDWSTQQVISRPARSRFPAPPRSGSARDAEDSVWSAVDGLVGVVSAAAEKLHDPAVQRRGVDLLADLAAQVDPALGTAVRDRARTWVGTVAERAPAPRGGGPEAPVADDGPTAGPDEPAGGDEPTGGREAGDPWRQASD